MTQQQFEELKSLIQLNAQGIQANAQGIQANAQGISRNYEMVGRTYEEHGGRLERLEGRLTSVEVLQEQHGQDLRAVAEGVTGNAERLDRFAGRFDGFSR